MTPIYRNLRIAAVGLFVLAGAEFLRANANMDLPPDPTAPDELVTGRHGDEAPDRMPDRTSKVALGNNADAVLSLDLIASGGAGNQRDDGVTTGNVSGRGTKIAIEVFATGVRTSLVGVDFRFDFDPSLVAYVKVENNAFVKLGESSFASLQGATLAPTGFLARAEFETVADVTGREFSIGIEKVTLADRNSSPDELTTAREISFNSTPSPDFDGDGTVGFSDFIAFAGGFGTSRGDSRYDARFDLDGDGDVGFSDFLIFAGAFGSEVPPSGGGGTPSGGDETVNIADDNLRAVIADSLGKASGAPITRAEMATLTRIYAPNKRIRNLTGLEHATNLQRLVLGRIRVDGGFVNSNHISDISPLSNLTNLTNLDLTSNRISSISALSNLTDLTQLHLGDNQTISDISVLSNLTELTRLNLWDNSISDISALANLTDLTYLSLSRNELDGAIPSELGNLTNLTYLSLSRNELDGAIPSELGNLTNLTVLALGGNELNGAIPSELGNLTNLEELYLWGNELDGAIPSELGNLTNLTTLWISDNTALKGSLPQSLTNLTKLEVFNYDATGLCAPRDAAFQTWLQGIEETKGENCSGTSPPTRSPDLIVESPSVNDNTLTTGQSFTLRATVRNHGNASAAATTLRYYRSSNATISSSDTEVGTDVVSSLSAGGTSAESISLNAPSDAGTYYYGACVESVSGESNTGNNCSSGVSVTVSGSGSPDLIVESPSVNDNTLTTGQSFTLRATVRNQGNASAAATTLRYYRSSNATISADDTEAGTDGVNSLSAGGTSAESISLNAPSSAGTYYYGACVDNVSGESNTGNNCSSGVSVTVTGGGGGGSNPNLGACRVGLVVNPLQTCTYKGFTFSVSSTGRGSIGFFSSGGAINVNGSTINGVVWNFSASRNSNNSWTIHTAR